MSSLKYLDAVRGILDHYEQTQQPAIEQAADLIVHALTNNGALFCAEIGHSNQNDFLNRAGGLAAVQAFSAGCHINDQVAECLKDRPQPEAGERDLETTRFGVRVSNLRAGDVLMLGSVSGKNRHPVELALACRDKGVKVIGFTALDYTKNVTSLHPSGKKLVDVCDVIIDNGAPYGDAVVEIPGVDTKVLPISGASMVIGGWLIFERVVEKMAEAGNPPSVFMSINREGGQEYYNKSREQYNKRGY